MTHRISLCRVVTRCVIESRALDIFYLHTKFGDCRLSRSGNITAGVELKNESPDTDHATLGLVCHP